MTQNKISEFFTPETPKDQVKTYPFTIEEKFHTKKEIPIWVLKLNKDHRLTRESFTQLKQEILFIVKALYLNLNPMKRF